VRGVKLRGREAAIAIAAAVVVVGLLVAMVLSTSGGGPTIVTTATAPPRAPRPAPKPPPSTSPALFSADSIWNARVDDPGVRLAAGSRAEVAQLTREAKAASDAAIGPFIAYKSFSTPLYVVSGDQPTVRVALERGGAPRRRSLQKAFDAVPLPSNARPAPGKDSHLTVVQPATDRLWEFFHLHRTGSGWTAGWGGAIDNVSKSPGFYNASSWPGARFDWGATATSLPVIGGTILISELQQGVIPHALAFAVPDARRGVWAFPAQRTDGNVPDPESLPEGAHLRLDPSVDVDKLDVPPVTKMIARAAQRYGIVLRDRTNRAPQFYVEDPAQFIAAHGYDPVKRIFDGLFPNELLAHFPWSRLQVIDARMCNDRSQPCPSSG
jgi:hypothetical protein